MNFKFKVGQVVRLSGKKTYTVVFRKRINMQNLYDLKLNAVLDNNNILCVKKS